MKRNVKDRIFKKSVLFLTASLIDNQVCEEDEEKSGGIPLDDISGAFIIVSVGILFAVIGRVGIKSFGIPFR